MFAAGIDDSKGTSAPRLNVARPEENICDIRIKWFGWMLLSQSFDGPIFW